jgi:enterochelin esterase-like enzyme
VRIFSPCPVSSVSLNPIPMRFCLVFALLFSLLTTLAPAQSRRRQAEAASAVPNAPIPVVSAPQARLLEGIPYNSSLLNRAVRYSIYLPPDYYTSNRHYPVVYLLHGYGDDETGWIQFGEADRIIEAGIVSGELPPMIVVMPDAGQSWYINDYQGKTRYEDMFTQEFVPHIDATFRTRPTAEFRGLAGLSMGGFGSLVLAMHHPELFGSCAAMSASARSDEMFAAIPDERYNTVFGPVFSGPVKGEERLTTTWKRNSPITLAKSAPEGDLTKVRWYIDCGDDDSLSPGNALLHIALTDRKIPHEYRVRDGAHTWTYWRTGLPDALKFIALSFHR